MKIENKRIFICDLPEGISESDLLNKFTSYGNVKSVDIKERKNIVKQQSKYFAYVNLEADDKILQKCLYELSSKKWNGTYVELQLAKESFMEKLKREREENKSKEVTDYSESSCAPVQSKPLASVTSKSIKVYKSESSPSESQSSDEDDYKPHDSIVAPNKPLVPVEIKNINGNKVYKSDTSSESEAEDAKPIIKVKIKNDGLEIDKAKSVSENENKKINETPIDRLANLSEAEKKRLQSVTEKKRAYQRQRNALKNALSSIDKKSNNKIVFGDSDNEEVTTVCTPKENGIKKSNVLFDDDEESDVEYNFENKEQFEGEKGQKLMQLQSKSKHDKRFEMSEKFLEEGENDVPLNNVDGLNGNEDLSVEQEKRKELEILEQILGKKVTHDKSKKTKVNTIGVRYDPTSENHKIYEKQNDTVNDKFGKEKKADKSKKLEEEIKQPEVSDEKFYEVTTNLKDVFQENQSFSLLNMFGKRSPDHQKEDHIEEKPEPIKKKRLLTDKNPFKYDSSDDEESTNKIEESTSKNQSTANQTQIQTWHEPFFFQTDDYRFQEGRDFIQKSVTETEDKNEFLQLRKSVKNIIKSKIKNALRKNRPFKKKLGSNNKRVIRKKKALKR